MTHDWDEIEPDPNQVTMLEGALVLPGGQSNIKLIRSAKALSCKRSDGSHGFLGVWPSQEEGLVCHLFIVPHRSHPRKDSP